MKSIATTAAIVVALAVTAPAHGQQTSDLIGTVYNDIDLNGVFDPTDTTVDVGTDGITLSVSCLFPSGLTYFDTTETDIATGEFSFAIDFLFAFDTFATCSVGIDPLSQLDPLLTSTTDTSVEFTALPGATTSIDFGLAYRDVIITGVVWKDDNGNGVLDSLTEIGRGGILVHGECTDISGHIMAEDVLTAADGSYELAFPCVTPVTMDCSVSVDETQMLLSHTMATTVTFQEFPGLLPGDTVADIHFGFVDQVTDAMINGVVFQDLNGDGIENPGEPGIEGMMVDVDCTLTGGGMLSTQLTTDMAGQFDLALTGGDCTVTVDPAQLSDHLATTPTTQALATLGPGDTADVAVGFLAPGTVNLSGVVWCDTNGDGIQDADEPGIENVAVNLSCTFSGGGTLLSTPISDANGHYDLEPELPPGETADCTLDVTPSSVAGKQPSTTTSYTVIGLQDGDDSLDNDFGFTTAIGSFTLTGTVFEDDDLNGVQDAEEAGLEGVDIAVECLRSSGVTVLADAVSGADGSYELVIETPLIDSSDCTVTADPDAFATASPMLVLTGPGSLSAVGLMGTDLVVDLDFGYGNTDALVKGKVFFDADSDGVRDHGERGIQGIEVSANCTLSDGSTTFQTKVTNRRGAYRFALWMHIDQTADCTLSVDPGAVDSAMLTTDASLLAQLNPGDRLNGFHFGFGPPPNDCVADADTRSRHYFNCDPASWRVVRRTMRAEIPEFGSVFELVDSLLGPAQGAPETFRRPGQAARFVRGFLGGDGLREETITLILNLGLADSGFEPITPSFFINTDVIAGNPDIVPPTTPTSMLLDGVGAQVGDFLQAAIDMLQQDLSTVEVHCFYLDESELTAIIRLINESYDDYVTGYVTPVDCDPMMGGGGD